MGLFSRKNHIGVASSVYNLAGDIDKRPQVLKETVFSSVVLGRPMAPSIVNSYLTGSGIRLRNFENWAEGHFNDTVGFSTGSLTSGHSIDLVALEDEVPATEAVVNILTADIGLADYSYWADQYVAENYPLLLGTDYVVDMDEAANEISITFEDTSVVTFTPADFDKDARYLYVSYVEVIPGTEGATTTGATIVLDPLDDFPDTTGWIENANVVTPHTETLYVETTVDVTYSDATPPTNTVTTTSSTEGYDEIHAEYEQNTPVAAAPSVDNIRVDRVLMYQDTVGSIVTTTDVDVVVEDIGGGVLRTTTTTVVTDVLEIERSYREDTLEVIYKGWSDTRIFIYKEDSGNSTLDDMFKAPSSIGGFFPFIPFRINNYDVKDTFSEEIYKKSKKAFKKATGGKYDDCRESINSNASIGDIDYCYAVFGVSLNTKENASKKYIYNFFKMLMEDPNRQTAADFDDWVAAWNEANDDAMNYIAWRGNPYDPYGHLDDEPGQQPYPVLPRNSLTIGSTNALMNYNVTLNWCFIDEETGSGLLDVTKKKGDLWFTVGTTEDYTETAWLPESTSRFGIATKDNTVDVIYLNWQVTATEWRRLTIRGLEHVNMIYGGKSVNITSKEALETVPGPDDTGESGFIIPLHEDVFRALSLKDQTQMGTACCYLMFNCYKVVKEKWYQTAFFRFILIVVAIVITVLSVGSDGGTTLGSAIAIGSGVTGTLGLLLAFAINFVIATLLIKLFQKIAIEIFGEEVGMVIGTIIGMFAYGGLNNMLNGQSFAASFGNMLRADNLLKLTFAAGNAYAEYMKGVTIDLQQQTAKLEQEIKTGLEEVQAKTTEMFGTNGLLDPTQMAALLAEATESPEAFLQRTLMVGSDIANLSISMLNNFTDITLSTDLPT